MTVEQACFAGPSERERPVAHLSWLLVRVGSVAMMVVAFLVFPSGEAKAGSRYSQLAAYHQTCYTQSILVDEETNCGPAQFVPITRIEGYNQNGDRVVWESKNYICDKNGRNVFFIPDWWWQFDHPEGVQVTFSNGAVYTVKTRSPVDHYWGFVEIEHSMWNGVHVGTDIWVRGVDRF